MRPMGSFLQSVYDALPEYKTLSQLKNAAFMLDLKWMAVEEKSRVTDKSIGDSGIRSKTGVTVVGIMRNGILYPNPDPEMIIRASDMVGIIGQAEQLRAFHKMIHNDS